MTDPWGCIRTPWGGMSAHVHHGNQRIIWRWCAEHHASAPVIHTRMLMQTSYQAMASRLMLPAQPRASFSFHPYQAQGGSSASASASTHQSHGATAAIADAHVAPGPTIEEVHAALYMLHYMRMRLFRWHQMTSSGKMRSDVITCNASQCDVHAMCHYFHPAAVQFFCR